MKYLVTDDSKLARRVLIKTLLPYTNEEHIFQACNGLEALKMTLKEKPDIVFLDLTMPEMDGYTALPKLLQINPDIKVVVVSADIQEQAKKKVLSLGAKFHISKPINPQKLKEILVVLENE
jgi:CheY-like chemotaxis protein